MQKVATLSIVFIRTTSCLRRAGRKRTSLSTRKSRKVLSTERPPSACPIISHTLARTHIHWVSRISINYTNARWWWWHILSSSSTDLIIELCHRPFHYLLRFSCLIFVPEFLYFGKDALWQCQLLKTLYKHLNSIEFNLIELSRVPSKA